jgi:vacuolar protein sorting-associated protein 52
MTSTAPIIATNNLTTTSLLSHNDPNHNSNTNNSEEHELLAHDLAQFLENPTLREALADGTLDLKSYSETIQNELEQLETECISVYRNKSNEIELLQSDLRNSQSILQQLHEMLLGFQTDLGGLSGDIRNLQQKSRTLDIQLKNRRTTENKLRQYLQHIVIAPTIVTLILHEPVNNMKYVSAVQEIQRLYNNCSMTTGTDWSCNVPVHETMSAGHEMKHELISLRNVAMKRIREYFLQQLLLLRQPQTNVRVIQVHGLLKYAQLYDFMEDYYITSTNNNDDSNNHSGSTAVSVGPNLAMEIYNVYIEIMSATLKQLFRTYSQQLLLLDSTKYTCTRNDVLAIDESILRESVNAMATLTKNHPNKKRMDPFSLNTRATDVLAIPSQSIMSTGSGHHHQQQQQQQQQQPLRNSSSSSHNSSFALPPRISVHVSILQKEQYPYERLYGSLIGHLLDAVTNEHVFCRQFFKRTDSFTPLFSNTISLLIEQIENYLFTCYDTICLLLMIQVTHSVRNVARLRKIYVLEPFFDQIVHLIWPRLKMLMDNHYRSIQQATAASLEVTDMHAHYVSRRFGEFCCSILLIMHHSVATDSSNEHTNYPNSPRSPSRNVITESSTTSTTLTSTTGSNKGTEESHHHQQQQHRSAGSKLLQDLSNMIDAYLQLLERVSEIHNSQKKRIVFLINNLDHVVCIFQERRVTGKECNKFLERLLKYREDFVEEELLTGFSKMIAFVQQTEAHIASISARSNNNKQGSTASSTTDYDVNPSVVESLVLDFASNWKSNIDQINRNVLSYFSNFRNGMEILKHCLTQLLLYYTRFQDIIRKVWKKSLPPFTKDLISTNAILAEIKRYALAI